MKAYYILGQYVKKYKENEIKDIYKTCIEKLTWSPEKIMACVMQKMVRCAEMNIGKAFMYWQIEWRRSKEQIIIMKKNRMISHMVNLM